MAGLIEGRALKTLPSSASPLKRRVAPGVDVDVVVDVDLDGDGDLNVVDAR